MSTIVKALLLALLLPITIEAQTRVLDQNWQFTPDPKAEYTATTVDKAAHWRPTQASLSWNSQYDDLRDYAGTGWYRITLPLPSPQPNTRQLLHFGAVDYLSEVWINGKKSGEHEGGYTPFTLDLTGKLHAGNNEILVKVFDPPMPPSIPIALTNTPAAKPAPPPAKPKEYDYNEIPHGKQNWYVQTSGIWQPVTLETVPMRYIAWVHVTPHNNGDVSLEARLEGTGNTKPLEATISDPYGTVVAKFELTHQAQTHIANPMLWDTNHPNLYTLEVTQPGQRYHTRFGFREFTSSNGRLYLNGKPFYMRAALDQDFYPEGIYTPPSAEFLRQEMLTSKALGLNMLRCHIKVPDPRYLEAADETGMLIWYEIPVWNDNYHWTPEAAQRGVDTFHAEVERDWNHPSIVIQSIMNEQWGMDNTQPNQRAWLLQTFHDLKQLTAPLGRLIDDDSPCCKGFHLQSDFADWHQYFSIPDHARDWAGWVTNFSTRPEWLNSNYGDARPTGQEPLLVSEFGNWGLPTLPPQDQLPWWFPRDFGGRDITRPAGVFDRLHTRGFDRIYPDYQALALATEHHEYLALKYEIEQMRQHASIQGYVITELTDANWEANGLMTMWRKPKVFAEELGNLQQDDLLMADFAHTNFTAGAPIEVRLMLSHYSAQALNGAAIAWQTSDGQSGTQPLETDIPASGVAPLGTLHFRAGNVPAPTPEFLRLQLISDSGATLAENRYRYAVYPEASTTPSVNIHDPLNQLAALKAALADRGVKTDDNQAVWITSALDDATNARLSQGGKILLLANSHQALPPANLLSIVPRAGSDLNGDWVSNFNWILPSSTIWKPLAPVVESNLLGWESASVTPEFVITGLGEQDTPKIQAGVFYGWLNDNRAYLADLPESQGQLRLTTFHFEAYGKDPFATALLNQLLTF